MTSTRRSLAFLAALASSAVAGLDPVSVRALAGEGEADLDIALVVDTDDRHWVIRCPSTPAAGARLASSTALLPLLARRVPFQVPLPHGFIAVAEGRATVHRQLPGRPLRLEGLPPGSGLAAELGRTLAAIHNLDRAVFEEAGVPGYDADSYRARHLADLDRGAATGHVPTSLLARWENALDDVTLWRFAPTPIHGRMSGRHVLAAFDSEDDATSGHVKAVVGWEDAVVADPAEDLADIVALAPAAALESVLEAYANSRIERPDPHLRRRAKLAAELRLLGDLLTATGAGAADDVRVCAAELQRLDERVAEGDLAAPAPTPLVPRPVPVSGAADPGVSRDDSGQSAGADPGEDTVGILPRGAAIGPEAEATQEIDAEHIAKARAASRSAAAGNVSAAASSSDPADSRDDPTDDSGDASGDDSGDDSADNSVDDSVDDSGDDSREDPGDGPEGGSDQAPSAASKTP